ncbi:Uma2 family endonuclease [Tautonia sp. JC769]|uniref:Uma2 family endonuclease n=1 Tax=Tautonia sp. JC769 TaxID=3232135 RepID=UPI0034597BCD
MSTEARPHLPPSDDVQDTLALPPTASPGPEGDLPMSNPSPLTLCFAPEVELTDDLFWKICAANPELRLERTAEGNLEIMYPAGGESSRQNFTLAMRLGVWNEGRGEDAGVCFDSSAGFKLPSGATKGPDASWIARDRWLALTPEQRRVFPPICPDFVAELRSPSDAKRKLRDKLREYLANGARLGWLIDPLDGTVERYRPGQEPETLTRPERLDGGDVLPGFVLDLSGILFE